MYLITDVFNKQHIYMGLVIVITTENVIYVTEILYNMLVPAEELWGWWGGGLAPPCVHKYLGIV